MKLEIHASLCEGPIFYFLVESINLFLSISSKYLSCCVSFIHMMIYSIMFLMFLVFHIALILVNITLKAIIENPLCLNSIKFSTILGQEQGLPLPIMIYFVYLYCVSFNYCKLSYIIVSCILL